MEETLLQNGLLSGCHKLSVSSSGSEVSTAVAAILADTVSRWSIYFCGIFSLCIVGWRGGGLGGGVQEWRQRDTEERKWSNVSQPNNDLLVFQSILGPSVSPTGSWLDFVFHSGRDTALRV